MKYFLVCFFSLLFIYSKAQNERDAAGVSFDLNSSKDISTRYSLKPSLKGRSVSLLTKSLEQESVDINSQRLDLQLALERSLKSSIKVALGGLYRFANTQNAVRLFEQIGWVNNSGSKIEFIHRIRSDQTFRKDEDIEFRLRYRVGLSFPLQGYKLNRNEKYLLVYSEYLAKYQSTDFSNELRVKVTLGQLLKNQNKAELGIDFRYDDPLQNNQERLYLLNIAYFFSTAKRN